MNKTFIITTPDQLRQLVAEAVAEVLPQQSTAEPIDTLTLSDALALLQAHGYPTSKAKVYKLTSANTIPHRVYGNKLVFSRKELLRWAEQQAKPKPNAAEVSLTLARSARRKR